MSVDEKTQHRSYPLPHPDNLMDDPEKPGEGDVHRLRGALQQVDQDVAAVMGAIEEAEILALALTD